MASDTSTCIVTALDLNATADLDFFNSTLTVQVERPEIYAQSLQEEVQIVIKVDYGAEDIGSHNVTYSIDWGDGEIEETNIYSD